MPPSAKIPKDPRPWTATRKLKAWVIVRASAALRDALSEAARARGMSRSAWIRSVLTREAMKARRHRQRPAAAAGPGEQAPQAAAPARGPLTFAQPAEPLTQPTPVTVLDTGGVKDNNGHGEDWWRAREQNRQARLAVAQKVADDAQFVADSAANASSTSRLSEEAGRAQVAELQARAALAQANVRAIEAELDVLKEECRKANCSPGWLR